MKIPILIEETAEKFCDNYCKYPYLCKSQDELDEVCDHCEVIDTLVNFFNNFKKDENGQGSTNTLIKNT